ncbi:class I SAM-dependent methyltransferase [Methylotuvimicrobium sp. KM1]|uniref:class I SAM-dependent methyltransferase n=1 Tax=Methylotuvimicrobium sp. KM1 TaxID=3377707 RepID=UPI00384D53E2
MSQDEHRQIAKFYDEIYYHEIKSTVSHPSCHALQLIKRLHLAPGDRLLDVACGAGSWLAAVAQHGADISGIDISERAIDACQRRLPEGVFFLGIAEQLPFDSHSFDIVTCLGSLEHFLDQPAALREMARVAKPNAKLVILVPNAGFPTYRFGIYRGTQQQTVRETIRSLDEWRKMLEEAGLEITDRWKDLHVLSRSWIVRPPFYMVPLRLFQALALTIWPLSWQYQVYHLCRIR